MDKNILSHEELISDIEKINEEFAHVLSEFSETQLNKVPEDNGWTAGQITEHIIKSNGGILIQLLEGEVTFTSRPFDEQVSLLTNIFRSDEKMKTAPILEPGLPPHNLQDLIKSLNDQKAQQLTTIKEKGLNELSKDLQFPPAPNGLTKYEWIVFMIEHTRRHLKQIERIYRDLT